ncbi:Putative colanic biosynthesis UDP-glucose lipid carrier transferase [Bhargavaea cecembensis DSE10]|uniref:Putative colanic biosynthesis UDP-glucose lipid carrier transferase n=1 Tax=Bhargavaea cecembensis DSE10 TaxID=1235279 RepID=M7NY12_9BACL|nr:sugar transferase [Bhargavaea cecembensis]EMR06570.1 Putative colanic biosynthesis UDP-glucose lipid carrier transferase [Bhargavaea cecembensis DSE10]
MNNIYEKFGKRVFDILVAIFALPFWLLIFIFVAPTIYITDRGPIFYNSSRLGENGAVFKMYKFRSMIVNAPDIRNNDGSTYNSLDDKRLTSIGRFIRSTSIDETPQILNVLKGDMSIVGPRPDLPSAITKYNEFQIKRLKVKPGITGYSQAFFRNSISSEQKYENDIYYTENVSLSLDIKIIIYTIKNTVKRNNIYQ